MIEQRATTIPASAIHMLEALQAKCQRLAFSECFGVLNRNGLDEAIAELNLDGLALVYADVDDLKHANALWGKSQVNTRIAAALKMRETDVICGQWFSGDEFVAFVPIETAYGFAKHWQMNFRAVDMSVSICIAEIQHGVSIEELTDQCDARLTHVKRLVKGLITYLD